MLFTLTNPNLTMHRKNHNQDRPSPINNAEKKKQNGTRNAKLVIIAVKLSALEK